MFIEKILDKFTNKNIAYYPGCLTRIAIPEKMEQYKAVLAQLGIIYVSLESSNLCCGSPVLNAGYVNDFNSLKEKNIALFNKNGAGRIISNCPSCVHTLKNIYGLKEAEHITKIIWDNIDKFHKVYEGQSIAYHDPCHMSRYLDRSNRPRNILKRIGFHIVEMDDIKEKSRCCGGGGGLKSSFPNLANQIAKDRLKQVKTDKIITTCPLCYLHLKENAPPGMEVLEFSDVLLKALSK
jgi:Fe-S oxidoreductase